MEENDSSNSISLTSEQKQKILDQATNSLCLIKTENLEGLGFFCLIPYLQDKSISQCSQDLNKDKLQPVLITCNSIFGFKELKMGDNMKLIYKNEEKNIIKDESRLIYSNKIFDITVIELKENEFPENIFLKLDDKINDFDFNSDLKEYFENDEIYLIYYLNGKEPKYSLDKIKEVNDILIKNYCSNENIPLGSPILNLETFNVIGIHQRKEEKAKYNMGKILFPVCECNKSKNNLKKIKLYNININDEPKCVLDLISQKFIKDKKELLSQLNENLESEELTEVYKNEVIAKFQSKITKIFDTKKDTNTLLNFISKVRGLPNLVAFIMFGISGFAFGQMLYLNGKIDLVKNMFSLEKKDSIGYNNNNEIKDEEYVFQVFRPQNFHIYMKIKIDSVYVMCYREEYKVKLLMKIKQKFKDNPIEWVANIITDEEYDREYFYKDEILIKNKEKVDELFENQKEIVKVYLEELIIYKIDD